MTTEPGGGDALLLLRERLAKSYYCIRWINSPWESNQEVHKEAYYEVVDVILAEIAAAGMVIVDAERFERLRAYVVADQEFRQADTWAGMLADDEVTRAAVNLQYAGREKRRREAHESITLGDLEPVVPGDGAR